MTPQELKNSILQLAIQGKLVEQRPEEGTAAELVEKILAAKNAKSAKKNLTRSRGARGAGEGMRGLSHLPKAALTLHGTHSATSASPREKIPDDEKPFDIPESWEWVRLESIINSIPSKQYQILESEVKPSGVFSVISQSKEYSIGFTDKSEKVYHHVNPVIVFGDHTAEVKFVEFDFVVGADGVKIFEPLDGIVIAKFLFYVLQFHSSDLSKVGGYSRHYKFLKEKPIPLPPLAEQKRIVAKIEELLPLIDRYEKAWSKLEDFNKCFPVDMQKSLLQMAIQGKLVEQRAEEGTAAELVEKILAAKNAKGAKKYSRAEPQRRRGKSASALSAPPREKISDDEKPFDIPESWEWVRLGNLLKVIGGVSYDKKDVCNAGLRILRGGNIQNMEILLDDADVFLPEQYRDNEKIVRVGDILIVASTGSKTVIGKAGYVDEPIPQTMIGAFLRICRPSLLEFVGYLRIIFESDFYRKHIRELSQGTNINNIKEAYITQFAIPLPPLVEQKRIVAKLEELLPLCERLK